MYPALMMTSSSRKKNLVLGTLSYANLCPLLRPCILFVRFFVPFPGVPEGEAVLRGCPGHFRADQLPRDGPHPRQALLAHQEVADADRGTG